MPDKRDGSPHESAKKTKKKLIGHNSRGKCSVGSKGWGKKRQPPLTPREI